MTMIDKLCCGGDIEDRIDREDKHKSIDCSATHLRRENLEHTNIPEEGDRNDPTSPIHIGRTNSRDQRSRSGRIDRADNDDRRIRCGHRSCGERTEDWRCVAQARTRREQERAEIHGRITTVSRRCRCGWNRLDFGSSLEWSREDRC